MQNEPSPTPETPVFSQKRFFRLQEYYLQALKDFQSKEGPELGFATTAEVTYAAQAFIHSQTLAALKNQKKDITLQEFISVATKQAFDHLNTAHNFFQQAKNLPSPEHVEAANEALKNRIFSQE